MEKEYLGDSVYICPGDGHIILTIENGFGPSNTIYLDDHVIKALLNYLERYNEEKTNVI